MSQAPQCSLSTPAPGGECRLLSLGSDQFVRIPHGRTWRIHCRTGLLWITAAGQMHDWVLRPGESAEFCGTDLLVGALRDSQMQLAPGCAGPIRHVSAWKAVVSMLACRLLRSPPSAPG